MAERRVVLAQTFVQLADTLVDGFDVIDLLTMLATRTVDLLDADAAGILLAGDDGQLHVVAASNEQARLLELFQIQNEEGPCHECFTTGRPVVGDLGADRWPRFAAEARGRGYQSVLALPLRLRQRTIGALNVFLGHADPPDPDDLIVTQSLADAATIAILQHAAMREARVVTEQLQSALNSRIAIEQAKGVIAERHGLDMDGAFTRLRSHARNHNLQLTALAGRVVSGEVEV
jgi:GAF domain-containing protein